MFYDVNKQESSTIAIECKDCFQDNQCSLMDGYIFALSRVKSRYRLKILILDNDWLILNGLNVLKTLILKAIWHLVLYLTKFFEIYDS